LEELQAVARMLPGPVSIRWGVDPNDSGAFGTWVPVGIGPATERQTGGKVFQKTVHRSSITEDSSEPSSSPQETHFVCENCSRYQDIFSRCAHVMSESQLAHVAQQ
jgi:hypothetical protein